MTTMNQYIQPQRKLDQSVSKVDDRKWRVIRTKLQLASNPVKNGGNVQIVSKAHSLLFMIVHLDTSESLVVTVFFASLAVQFRLNPI